MVSKSQIKLITSLHQKKYRDKTGLFVAEGPKVIEELITGGFELYLHCTTESITEASEKNIVISQAELQKLSFLKTANSSLAVFKIPKNPPFLEDGIILALDAVRDPGNLGTIVRLCDWFGITQLLCSIDTVDCYNPKVIQATMGSISRVNIHYLNLAKILDKISLPIFGGCMDGENVYRELLPSKGVIVMGNEANGISDEIEALLTKKITIPQFGTTKDTESLNVATATAILLSEFKRPIER